MSLIEDRTQQRKRISKLEVKRNDLNLKIKTKIVKKNETGTMKPGENTKWFLHR